MKSAIEVAGAPKAIGPYSQAIQGEFSRFVFCSGQIGLVPESGKLAEGGIEAEARQAFENVKAVLAGAGLGLSDVVKVTVFLEDMNDFGALNEVYGEFFEPPFPARSCFAVSALPKGAKVEIEAIAAQ